MTTTASLLETPLTIGPETVSRFEDQGFVILRDVLPAAELSRWRQVIADVAHGANRERRPLAERDTYGKAFLQTMNLWELDRESDGSVPSVVPFVFSRRLASIARQLLGVSGVRLYHDQALFKEAGGGHTPWHADQFYWPLDSDRTVTAWIPLVDVPREMGPLAFATGSHRADLGRDLEISDQSEARIERAVREQHLTLVEEPFALGDVSFHFGWTFHRAGPNRSDRERTVMTMIYMDESMRLKEPENRAQASDHQRWCPGVEPGAICDSPLNPVIPSR